MSKKFVFLMLLPALSLYTVFFIFPTIQALYYSFFQWSGFGNNMTWVGFGNYIKSFGDSLFLLSLKNTIYIIFVGGFFTFFLAFLFSLALSSGMAGKRVPRSGLFNIVLEFFGLNRVLWTSGDNIFWAMLVAMIWTYLGFYIVVITAGMEKIPRDLYEAAELDGATMWQKFRFITIPLIWDVVLICFTIWIILAVKNFEFPYAFGGLNIPQELYNTSVMMYISGFGQRYPVFQLGYASAIGVESLLLAMFLVVVVRRLLRRRIEEL